MQRLEARGVDLFRINLSHTPLDRVESTIRLIREHSATAICLDTEGAQVRTGPLAAELVVRDHQRIVLAESPTPGPGDRLTLTPGSVFAHLRPNMLVTVDFDGVVLLVLDKTADGFESLVLNGGRIGSNKAVTLDPSLHLPPLSEKDVAAVQIGRRLGVKHYALSFTNAAQDVRDLRELAGPEATLIAKIESKRGVENIDDILAVADEILIDRGDLSREVPLENLPFLQKAIIGKANAARTPVNVATNLLESMIVNRKPTRAELNDVANTLLDGASGLVLAAETAIGSHPVRTVDIVLGLIENYRRSLDGFRLADLLDGGSLMLPSLHGQQTDRRLPEAGPRRTAGSTADRYPSIEIDPECVLDVEQLGGGGYSPLRGFMNREELESVLNDYRLPTGEVWPMPIVLQGKSQEFAAFHPGQSIRLVDQRTGESTAVLFLEEKYEIDLQQVARRWFGTTDRSHPGVARFMSRGVTLLGGPIEYLGPSSVPRSPYQLTPRQTRLIFDAKGWTRIVGFHTRNVPHRGHEHVILQACERAGADGILIHPVIGLRKLGDFTPSAILSAYERLIAARVPQGVLAAFGAYSRFCGPREAVFTALCRKNYGCTHFIVGRDHAGVGGFYAGHDTRALFDALGDIGIAPVYFDSICVAAESDETFEALPGATGRPLSGTAIRDFLARGEQVPEWCMEPDISAVLTGLRDLGQPLFT